MSSDKIANSHKPEREVKYITIFLEFSLGYLLNEVVINV